MKISRRQIRNIILQERENIEQDFISKVGNFMDTGLWDEDPNPRKTRHPKLNAVLDAVQDAVSDVPRSQLKQFLWNLNSTYANTGKIMETNKGKRVKLTKRQLKKIIREEYDRLLESPWDDKSTAQKIMLKWEKRLQNDPETIPTSSQNHPEII